MQQKSEILKKLASQGFRITLARKAIIDLLMRKPEPLSAKEIQTEFFEEKIQIDKVTIYRELEFLEKNGVIVPVQFDDRNRRYEISTLSHHHHLICERCRRVEDVVLQNELGEEELLIEKNKHFKVTRHSLEFFGLCASCR